MKQCGRRSLWELEQQLGGTLEWLNSASAETFPIRPSKRGPWETRANPLAGLRADGSVVAPPRAAGLHGADYTGLTLTLCSGRLTDDGVRCVACALMRGGTGGLMPLYEAQETGATP